MSPDPITTLREALQSESRNLRQGRSVAATYGQRQDDALAALEQVRTLVEAAKAMDSALEFYDKGPMQLAPSVSHAYSKLVVGLQPFISVDTESEEGT